MFTATRRIYLFLLYRSDHHRHPLTLQRRHVLGPSELLKLDGKTKQLLLSLVGEHDGVSTEEDGCLHLGALLEELAGMLQFELEVMLISVGTEADLLDCDLGSILLHLLGLLPLLVEVLLVVEDLADRRISLGADLNQVKLHLVGHLQGLGDRIDARLGNVVTDKTDLRSKYLLIYVQFILRFLADK